MTFEPSAFIVASRSRSLAIGSFTKLQHRAVGGPMRIAAAPGTVHELGHRRAVRSDREDLV